MLLKNGEQGVSQIPKQMKAIRHLSCLWGTFVCRLGIGACAIPGNDANTWVGVQPGGKRLGVAVFEQCHRLVTFEVDNDCAVALSFAPGPIVDSDDLECCG